MIAGGEIDLDALKEMEYTEARTELMRLSGIGGKVADCICLFALHQMDAFRWIPILRKCLSVTIRTAFRLRDTGAARE